MFKKIAPIALGLAAAALAACGMHGGSSAPGSNGSAMLLPPIAPDMSITALLPRGEIGEDYPSVLGTVRAGHMDGKVGGFTQTARSQSLAFAPGVTIVIRNLSKTTAHTLNVVEQISSMSGKFPANPNLSTHAHGSGGFGPGYASGVIEPGKTVRIKLMHEGIYIIGCAFHYPIGMRDVIEIKKGARPGPQATPIPQDTPTPKPTSPGGW